MSSSPTPSTRHHPAAVAAVVAVLARIASIFLWPPDSDASHARMLAAAGGHHGAWTAATAAEVLAWLSAGCAVLAVVPLARHRGRWAVRIGGWVYGVSLITLGFVGGAMNSVTGVLAQEPNRALMVRVQGDLQSPVLNTFLGVVLIGELMMVAFAVGLARAEVTGWWYVALSVLAVAGYVVTSDSSNHLVVLAGFAPLGATWLVLAGLLSTSRTAAVQSRSAAVLVA